MCSLELEKFIKIYLPASHYIKDHLHFIGYEPYITVLAPAPLINQKPQN